LGRPRPPLAPRPARWSRGALSGGRPEAGPRARARRRRRAHHSLPRVPMRRAAAAFLRATARSCAAGGHNASAGRGLGGGRARAAPAAARPADSPPPRAGSHHSTTHADGGARGVVVRRLHLLHLPPSFLRLRLRLGPRVCDGHAVLRAARRPARGGAGRWDEGAEEIAQRDDCRGQPRPLSPPLRKPCSASALTWTSPSS